MQRRRGAAAFLIHAKGCGTEAWGEHIHGSCHGEGKMAWLRSSAKVELRPCHTKGKFLRNLAEGAETKPDVYLVKEGGKSRQGEITGELTR